jgi:hypothetical protein
MFASSKVDRHVPKSTDTSSATLAAIRSTCAHCPNRTDGRPNRTRRGSPGNHRQHAIAAEARDQPHKAVAEILAQQPPLVPDQQLDSRMQAEQPTGIRPQRSRQLIEARNVSGIPSGL